MIGVFEGGQLFYVRTDQIHCPTGYCLQCPRGGRPVFATNDLPFGGVHTSTGGIDLRGLKVRLREKLKDRPKIEPIAHFNEVYAELGVDSQDFLGMWSEIANALSVSDERMRPEDKLNALAGQGEISPRMELLTDFATLRSGTIGSNSDLATITTVDDYIRQLGKRH